MFRDSLSLGRSVSIIVLLALSWAGCSSSDEQIVEPGVLTIEVEGVPEDHRAELVVVGGAAYHERFQVTDGELVVGDLDDGAYTLEARTIPGEERSWVVEDSFQEFDFELDQGKALGVTYEVMELEISDRAVGIFSDDPEYEALIGTQELVVGDPESDDYDPYQDTRELRFNASLLEREFQEGDLLSFEPNEHLPYGYLGEVQSLQQDGHELVLITRRAPLTDLVLEGSVATSGQLDPSLVEIEDAIDGFYDARDFPINDEAMALLGPNALFGFGVDLTDDGLCFGVDGISVIDNDEGSATVNGSYCLDLDFAVDHRIIGSTLDFFEFTSTVSQVGQLGLELEGSLDVNHRMSVPMMKLPLPPITFTVGPVPVTINIYIRPMLEVGASIDGELSLDLEIKSNIQAGVSYRGDDIHPIIRHNASAEPEVSNRVDNYRLRGGAGPNIDTLLYDTAGPSIGASGFVELDVEVGRSPAWWNLYSGSAGFIGFRLQLPGLPFVSWSDEVRVGETRTLIHSAPFGERGYAYYGESEILPYPRVLPCTAFDEVQVKLFDTYRREPETFFADGMLYGESDLEFVGSIPYGDEGRESTWRADGFAIGRSMAGNDHRLLRLESEERRLATQHVRADGTGATMAWTSEAPEGAGPAVASMERLDHPDYQPHSWQETLEGDTSLDCVPPGQYRLEVDGLFQDDTYYRPVIYDFDDFTHSDPLAIGDPDEGLSFDFHAGSADAWVTDPSINPRFRLRYEDLPVAELTAHLSQGTEYLADDNAVLTIERGDQSWEVEFSEDQTSQDLRFHEAGTYQLHLEPPSHYQGLDVTASLPSDEVELSLSGASSIGGSLFVSSPSVGNPNPSSTQLGAQGGEIDIDWQADHVNAQTIEVSPSIGDPLELDGDAESATLDFPANDTLEPIDYTVTIIGHGVDGETEETSLDVRVLGIQPASLNLQVLGLDSQASATAVVDGPQGDSWTLDGSFPASLSDLYPGTYTITPGSATGQLYDYAADPITIDLDPGQSENLTLSYAATTGALNLGAANLDDLSYSDLATITGPDGFEETLSDASAQWTHLSPGTYAVSATDELDHSDGSTFAVTPHTFDLTITAGEQTSHTLDYERVEGWLHLEMNSGLAPEVPTVQIVDASGATVATADESGGLWLAPGTYTLSSPGFHDAAGGELYFTTGLASIAVDSDTTSEVTLTHERVDGVFSASPASVSEDQPTTELNWDVEGDDSLSLEITPDIGSVDLAGSQSITATSAQLDDLDELDYTLTISNDAGSIDWNLTIPIQEDLPVLQWATVNGTDSVIVAPEDELTFEWEVTGPTPDWWDLPFLFEPLDDMEMSGSHTVTAWDINCWQYCFFAVEHELDDGSWHVDGIELEIFVGEEPSFNDSFDDELYTVGGQSYQIDLNTMTDDALELDVDLDDSMVESIDYVHSFFPAEEYLEIEMADDAVGTETLELTLSDVFGDLDFEITVHAGVVNGDDDVDDPLPGSLRWVADQAPETIRFDPDVFVPDADPIVLDEVITFDHPVTVLGTGPNSTILQRADSFDDATWDGALAFTNADGTSSMEYVLRDLAINDSPRQALLFNDADVQHGLLDNVHLEGNGWALDSDDGPSLQSPLIFTGGADSSDDDNSLRIIDSYIGDNQGWETGAVYARTHRMEIINSTIEHNTTLRINSTSPAIDYAQTEAGLSDDHGLSIEDSSIAHNSHHGVYSAGSIELRNTEVLGHDQDDYAGLYVAARLQGNIDIINPRFFRFVDASIITDNHYGIFDNSQEHGCLDISSDTAIEDNAIDLEHLGTGDPFCP